MNAIGNYKETPLHEAVNGCAVDAIKILIRHGADVNMCDQKGLSPFAYIGYKKSEELLDALLKGSPTFVSLKQALKNVEDKANEYAWFRHECAPYMLGAIRVKMRKLLTCDSLLAEPAAPTETIPEI